MLDIKDIKAKLASYNLSTPYGPTVYMNNSKTGITLDIKDSTFGYLTRCFTFNNIEDLDTFIKKYLYYKNSKLIKLSLDDYLTSEPNLIYTYQQKELTLEDMTNLNSTSTDPKNIYINNIINLTNYLIDLININYTNNQEKNELKIQENDLKYNLLEALTTYYGKNKTNIKKNILIDNINLDTKYINELKNNIIDLNNKSLDYLESYLKELIAKIKNIELNEKNIVNIYSINVYKYNINILKKQIEFVNNKINSELNFNLKGSKIHNIDAELKSFLKIKDAPLKYDKFLKNYKENINNKYIDLDLLNAYQKICEKKLVNYSNFNYDPLELLNDNFNSLDNNLKYALILYNSFYKKIINYIIDNNYPNIDILKNNFDMNYYYDLLDEIIHHESNLHYLKYFNLLDFKNIDLYLNSLINIAHIIDNASITYDFNIYAFTLNNKNLYKELNINPLYNNNSYLIKILPQTPIIYINKAISIDINTKEINLINTTNIYYKGNINLTKETISVNNYERITQKDKKNGIITIELKLNKSTDFRLGEIKND